MNEYISDWLQLIRHGSNVNSYKLAWARAIVEISSTDPENKTITLRDIAQKVFGYYWNQTIYFDLEQGNNPNKRPEIVLLVKDAIEDYYSEVNNRLPIHFEKVEHLISPPYGRVVSVLKKDVSWRFLLTRGNSLDVYSYSKGDNELTLYRPDLLADFSDILLESINFKWTLILENFNSSPRIGNKVRIIDFPDIKRGSLGMFREYLNCENPNHICFICDNKIAQETPALDHVIPWSYLYSDDLWNLVYVHQSCNSIKSNSIPSDDEINRLEERNIRLLKQLNDNQALGSKKPTKELETAIERDYVKKFYVSCKS